MKIELATCLLAGLASAACQPQGSAAASQAPPDAEVRPPTPVRTTVVKGQPFTERIEVSGTVEAPNDATLSAQGAGTLTTLLPLGTLVKKGQRVARFDQTVPKAALQQARAQIESARAVVRLAQESHDRQKPLYEGGIISALEFQSLAARLNQAQAALQQAEALRDQAKKQLENTRIIAPFDGRVEVRLVEPGEQVAPGMAIVRVVDSSKVKIRAGVPERYATDVRVGARVEVRFSAYGIPPKEATATFVGSTIDRASRTFPVEVRLDNPGGRLKPEMIAHLRLSRSQLPDALVVPQSSLLRDVDGVSLFVVEAGRALRRAVELGASSDGRVVITKGLKAGDEVVVLGQANLTTGDAVEPER